MDLENDRHPLCQHSSHTAFVRSDRNISTGGKKKPKQFWSPFKDSEPLCASYEIVQTGHPSAFPSIHDDSGRGFTSMGAAHSSSTRRSDAMSFFLGNKRASPPSICSHLFSLNRHLLRHRRRRLSSGRLIPSWDLSCWPLRSFRLNCQSLWTTVIGTGGWTSLGG